MSAAIGGAHGPDCDGDNSDENDAAVGPAHHLEEAVETHEVHGCVPDARSTNPTWAHSILTRGQDGKVGFVSVGGAPDRNRDRANRLSEHEWIEVGVIVTLAATKLRVVARRIAGRRRVARGGRIS